MIVDWNNLGRNYYHSDFLEVSLSYVKETGKNNIFFKFLESIYGVKQ